MKWAIFLISVLIGTLFIFLMTYQNVTIINMKKEIEQQNIRIEKNEEIIKEAEEKNKRYLDSCLDFILLLEQGASNE